ncbi:MAG: tetratricopeptide repeat protein [Acidobacteriota bacterium]|nr:tetratricopeptide repeat protein [Acidobacteriota bacterium]
MRHRILSHSAMNHPFPLAGFLPALRRWTAGAFLMLLSALLSACGAADEDAATTGAAASPETPAAEAEIQEIPEPDLSGLDPLVAERIRERRRWQRAVDAAPDALAPQQAEALGELGNLYHAYRLLPSAQAAYENAQRLATEDPRWPYFLGHLHRTANRDDQALEAFQRSLELRPDHVAAQVRMGEVLLDQNRPEEAATRFEKALELDPENAAALFGLGQIAAGRGETPQAVERFRRVLELNPEATSVHYPLGLAYRQLGDEAAAEEQLSRRGEGEVSLQDPLMERLLLLSEGYRALQKEGGEAFNAGRMEDAERAFRTAVAADPLASTARVNLASVLLRRDKPEEAIQQLQIAQRLNPEHLEASRQLAALLLEQGRRREAVPALRTMVRHQPDDASLRLTLALGLEESGEFEQALAEYRQVLQAEPRRLAALLGRASAQLQLERYAEARSGLEQALAASRAETGRPSGELANALARVLATVPEDSVRDGQQALEIANGLFNARPDAEHAETLAMALAETGDFQNAIQLQQSLAAKAREAGAEELATYYRQTLQRYRQGQPSRAPWKREAPASAQPQQPAAPPPPSPFGGFPKTP